MSLKKIPKGRLTIVFAQTHPKYDTQIELLETSLSDEGMNLKWRVTESTPEEGDSPVGSFFVLIVPEEILPIRETCEYVNRTGPQQTTAPAPTP